MEALCFEDKFEKQFSVMLKSFIMCIMQFWRRITATWQARLNIE